MAIAEKVNLVQVGRPFDLVHPKQFLGKSGPVMEFIEGIGFVIIQCLPNMSKFEKAILTSERIQVRIVSGEKGVNTVLLRYGNTPLVSEIVFDPTLYPDDRVLQALFKTNLVTIFGVDSATGILETMRCCNMPKSLHHRWCSAWAQAQFEEGFSQYYRAWKANLDRQHTTMQLWETGVYLGKMGE